jgi:hypothetical protein
MSVTPFTWRKSTFSGSSGSCVEVAQLPDGGVLVRNSNDPGAGTLTFTPAEMKAWIAGCQAGEFDDLAG